MNEALPVPERPGRQIPPPLPLTPLQPLQYFGETDPGWERLTRLILIFMSIASAARLFSGLGNFGAGFGAGLTAIALDPWSSVQITAQTALPLIILIAALTALSRRTRGIRLTIIWCQVVSISFTALASIGSYLTMLNRGSFMSGWEPRRKAAYWLYLIMSQVAGLTYPILIVFLLTLPAVRRRFGENAA